MADEECRRDDAGFAELAEFISHFTDKKTALIKVLYEAQRLFGFLSREVMLFVADKLDVPVAKIYGVVSFYSYFTTTPKGKKQIKCCMGTACFVRGAEKIISRIEEKLNIKRGETTSDLEYSLDSLRCVGACGLAPVVLVNDQVFGKLETPDVDKILAANQG
ncbi:MAG: NAD(P)H-dependent oxidoreductase subunit E [Desulfovibrio sp.]|jgi:NADH:ubiquinone oxidoreductase subunit E|nr:NAD(P)H-dependent oxidoreductase subunit E [Desulfovibrio sp.]